MIVDIMCAVLNGARFMPDFFRGLDAQTHGEWRLWVRDDGSTDGTVDWLRERAARDPRVTLLHVGGPAAGATRAFAWLLDHVPADARYVMLADADDVWLPAKIEASFAAMLAAEREHGAAIPLLVHTDMIVVDEALATLHPSFWDYQGIQPEPASLRRIAIRNVVTGPTVLVNRALAEHLRSMPTEAIYHAGWSAMVAAGLGRIVALRDKTVLYRQHGANAVGAAQSKAPRSWRERQRAVARGVRSSQIFRRNLERTARQAGAYLDRFGPSIGEGDRAFLEAYSRIPRRPFLKRKLDLFRFHALAERGILKTLGDVVRG